MKMNVKEVGCEDVSGIEMAKNGTNNFYYEMTVEYSCSVTMEKIFEVSHALVVPHKKKQYLRSNIVL
jgi:hypothetical protein